MTDLLPCPFCGYAKPRYVFDCSQGYICCDDCGTQGPCDERAADPICSTEAAEAAWNRRTALEAQPEPVGATDEQINQCYAALYGLNTDKLGLMPVRFGRELLARWGRSAIEPIPVSERPWEREGWCDAEGKCWFLRDLVGDYTWSLEDPASTITFGRNYSLPHWALPTPRSEEIF